MKMSRLIITILLTSVVSVSQAEPIYLSDYLGVLSGESTYTGDGVYSTVEGTKSYGFGADVAGSWVSPGDTISFSGNVEFEKGIGAHPNKSGEVFLHFNLDAFRADGYDISEFVSVVGIDVFSGGQPGSSSNGAIFNIYLDDVLVKTQSVAGTRGGSYQMNVLISDQNHQLSLSTTRLGSYNANHAAWGDAYLEVGPATNVVSEPSLGVIMGIGLLGMLAINRKNGRIKQP